MRSDFKPVHLKEANAKLDRDLVSFKQAQKENKHPEDDNVHISLWEKFLGFFKTNPSELHEDLYKHK
jgi:DNA/RNA-binding domain of Phe-tRNA-synthetase-like protein